MNDIVKHHIASSDKGTLNLTQAEYNNFQHEEYLLWHKYYNIERAARGIWASNQNKYVTKRSELTDWDSTFMEDTYVK